MRHRRVASALFIAGLIIGIIALFGLGELDSYLSRFGDGSGSTSNTAGVFNWVFALLICSYFVVSAVGVLLASTRTALVTVAGLAHTLLLAAYLMIGFEGYGGSTFVIGMLAIAAVALILFLPWLGLWGYIMWKSWRVE